MLEGPARGFVCENYGQKFQLPGRGPIGANCMANRRDFKTPIAAFEDREAPSTLTIKWCGQFHRCEIGHSPLDVVAWHGNYAPAKYDLNTYCPVGAILFDHPDPSIYTVLTAPSGVEGTANIDFVVFRDRWNVAEDTFRPPWYHKNVMSELMGNIHGQYDAKPQGFVPGGMSLHNCMLPHGPDREAFEKASNADLAPAKLEQTMSFMFETRFPQHLTEFAANEAPLQDDYVDCWDGIEKSSTARPASSERPASKLRGERERPGDGVPAQQPAPRRLLDRGAVASLRRRDRRHDPRHRAGRGGGPDRDARPLRRAWLERADGGRASRLVRVSRKGHGPAD